MRKTAERMKRKPDALMPADPVTYKQRVITALARLIRQETGVHHSRAYGIARRMWREGVVIA